MMESDWRECRDPEAMLLAIRASENASDRRSRLFVCACARRVWHLLTEQNTREGIRLAEQHVEGLVTAEELAKANVAFVSYEYGQRSVANDFAHQAACCTCRDVTYTSVGSELAAEAVAQSTGDGLPVNTREKERAFQSALVRDIYGPLAFREVHLAPSWRAATVVALAEAIYELRSLPDGHLDGHQLAVLADALEEAGCDNEEVLGHLRGPEAVHVRGCWCIDLILNRK